MNVIHRDLKLPNILVHNKSVSMESVLNGGSELDNFKKTTNLIGDVEVVVADLGFAKLVQEGDLT